MSSEKVRVAFIGAGKQANWRHYPSVVSQPDVELVAVCDRHTERAEEAAQRWGAARTFADAEEMLREAEPDAVYVITSPETLHEPVMQCLRAGRHVFIEKPPGVTLNQIQVFAHFAEQNNCLTMVGFQRRFVPAMMELKRRVEERGPIHSVLVANMKSTRNFDNPASSGILDQLTSDGMHAVDNLRWLCGGEVERVTANARRLYVPGPGSNVVMAQVEFSSGAVGQLHYSHLTGGGVLTDGATAPGVFRAEIHGKNVSAVVDAERQSYIVADNGEPEVFGPGDFSRDAGETPNHWLGFWHQTRHFIDSLKAGEQPSSNFADAAKSVALVHAIHAAAGWPA